MKPRKRDGFRAIATSLIALGLLAACSGVGVERATNPYEVICSDEKAYIDAFHAGDDAGVADAIAQMQTDFALIPDRQPRLLLQQAVDSASKGNSELIEQSYLANCSPVPSAVAPSDGMSPAIQT